MLWCQVWKQKSEGHTWYNRLMERPAEQESQPDTVQSHQLLVPSAQRPHPQIVKLQDHWHAHCQLSDVVDVCVSHRSTRDIGLWQELNVKLRFTWQNYTTTHTQLSQAASFPDAYPNCRSRRQQKSTTAALWKTPRRSWWTRACMQSWWRRWHARRPEHRCWNGFAVCLACILYANTSDVEGCRYLRPSDTMPLIVSTAAPHTTRWSACMQHRRPHLKLVRTTASGSVPVIPAQTSYLQLLSTSSSLSSYSTNGLNL